MTPISELKAPPVGHLNIFGMVHENDYLLQGQS